MSVMCDSVGTPERLQGRDGQSSSSRPPLRRIKAHTRAHRSLLPHTTLRKGPKRRPARRPAKEGHANEAKAIPCHVVVTIYA